jgi:hypothetical protein
MQNRPWTHGSWIVGYDPARRRLWICGQRVHHGSAGVMLTLFGTLLMAHDRRDLPLWFERGRQNQP